MQFGVCTSVEKAALAKAVGFDYVEENVQGLFQGLVDDSAWTGPARMAQAALPVRGANCLLPADLKVVGPDVNPAALAAYMSRVLPRAASLGCNILVFGSGGARKVPDGFSHAAARGQIITFVRSILPLLEKTGVTLVLEHLNQKECNIVTSVAEELGIVREVNHPKFQALVDSYHLWLEDEPLTSVTDAGKLIAHVHVADREGRVGPGQSGKSDYKSFFHALKSVGYDRCISVEASGFDVVTTGPQVLSFLKQTWANA